MNRPWRRGSAFRRDPAKDQRQQHEDQWHVEGRQHRCTIPHRCHGIDHEVALGLATHGREKNTEPEVETVEDHIEEHRSGDEDGPDQWQRVSIV